MEKLIENDLINETSKIDDFAAKKAEIKNIDAKKIMLEKPMDKKAAEEFVRMLLPIKNLNDGQIVEIPVNTIWKLFWHKGFNYPAIIKEIPSLFETSILGWSELEIHKIHHKAHPNIKAYRHYINKFSTSADNEEYFIRFIVTESKTKSNKAGKNLIHSATISKTSIYRKGDGSQRIRLIDPGEANSSPFIDIRLRHFFNSVKQ